MVKTINSLTKLGCCVIFLLLSCSAENPVKTEQYFSVQIDHHVWTPKPLSTTKKYNVSYKALSHQLSILAEAEDGSRMEVSFHDAGPLKEGNYPSIISGGIQSGIYYSPKERNTGGDMASATYDVPVQENTVQVTRLDRSDPKAYIIEGTFSATLYALYKKNPKRSCKLSKGRFRVVYYPDAYHPEF